MNLLRAGCASLCHYRTAYQLGMEANIGSLRKGFDEASNRKINDNFSFQDSPPTRTTSFSPLTRPAFISSNPFPIPLSKPPSTSLLFTQVTVPSDKSFGSCFRFLLAME